MVERWEQGQVSARKRETGEESYDESVIMCLQLRLQSTSRARIGRHSFAEGPLVDCSGVFLKERRGNERFENE